MLSKLKNLGNKIKENLNNIEENIKKLENIDLNKILKNTLKLSGFTALIRTAITCVDSILELLYKSSNIINFIY